MADHEMQEAAAVAPTMAHANGDGNINASTGANANTNNEGAGGAAGDAAAGDNGDAGDNGETPDEFKLIVLNYGKWKNAKSMDTFLREHDVAFRKVQKSRQLSFGFVHFTSAEQRDAALPKLQALTWSGERMEIKTALPRKSNSKDNNRSGRHGKKRTRETGDGEDGGGEGGEGGDGDANDEAGAATTKQAPSNAREAVTPWADVPYAEQLERKEAEMKKVLVKIVRQTRKEYFKKEKRMVAGGQQRRAKKLKSLEGDADGAAVRTSTDIPSWLTSHGSLFLVADGVLYSRPHEASAGTTWRRIIDAPGVTSIVSFGSELVAATDANAIIVLRQGATSKFWETLCAGPLGAGAITSLASLRGSLLCCTNEGKVLKQEGTGRFATGQWTQISAVAGARTIVMHNGFVYAFCPRKSDEGVAPMATELTPKVQWLRAPLTADALDELVFEPMNWSGETAAAATPSALLGLCSHDHQMILLSDTQSLIYAVPEGDVQAPIALNLGDTDDEPSENNGGARPRITGFASHKGLCCAMDSIHASPVTEGYRNKCEFSIGRDAEDKPCVGFRRGLFRDGSVIVSPPTGCPSVSPVMETVCAFVQTIIETSGLAAYDVKTKLGFWRLLTVRHSERTQQLMVVMQINPRGISPEDRARAQTLLVDTLTSPASGLHVTSLYVQEYEGVSAASEDEPLIHLHGTRSIEEHLLGMRFSVSPNAFFQVNTPGAENLYSLVKTHTTADANTLLYDVCCGTGTIGICAAAGVGKVVGIELCKAATEDAAVNAALNNVTNVTFVNSKAEDVMRDLLKAKPEESQPEEAAVKSEAVEGAAAEPSQPLSRVVAIVDPPRGGLHHQVLRSLRSCQPVDRIVYVSCNPTGSLIQDAMTLCGPKTKSVLGKAFKPVHAIPVDMFPHTPHCEMIIIFDRVDKEQ